MKPKMSARRIVVYIGAYPLYWGGCFFSLLINVWSAIWPDEGSRWAENIFSVMLYGPYNWCMVTSYEIEAWAGTEIIWEKA